MADNIGKTKSAGERESICLRGSTFEISQHLGCHPKTVRRWIIRSIQNSSLNKIEDFALGFLDQLSILDLRYNHLVTLSWRIFQPSIFKRNPSQLSILLEGNPLSKTECGSRWVNERLEENRQDIWSTEDDQLIVGSNLESKKKNSTAAFVPNSDSKFRNGSLWTFSKAYESTRNLSAVTLTGINGEFRGSEEKLKCIQQNSPEETECYICLPLLEIVSKNESTVHVRCSAQGIPLPEVHWEFENDSLFNVENLPNAENGASNLITFRRDQTLSQLAKSETGKERSLAKCWASNDRGIAEEDICKLEELNLQMDVQNEFIVKIEVNVESILFLPDPLLWEWGYSPCTSRVKIKGIFIFYKNKNNLGGHLRSPKRGRLSAMTPGWYRLRVTTPCGMTEKRVIRYDAAPHQKPEVECPLIHRFQSLNVRVKYKDKGVVWMGNENENSSATGTAIGTTIPFDSRPRSTPQSVSEDYSMSILAGVSVALVLCIACVWSLSVVVLKRCKLNRRILSRRQRNSESPFISVFLDKGTGGRKYAIGLDDHEMNIISPDRFVENPRYDFHDAGLECNIESRVQPNVISSESLQLISELGEGAFGRVYLGLMDDKHGNAVKVAVKMLKTLGSDAQAEMKREVEMLSSLQHEKIIKFHGICNDSETLLMIFEYMEQGDLNNYLRLHNEEAGIRLDDGCRIEPLSVMDCLQIALQIASGMTYLASQRYVHRDLATRNCLVTNYIIVKIGDFGMSRDVYTSDYYQIGGRALIPVRWMPPESILYRKFTIESDIWSFGVVLWEIFTGGKQPWYGYTNQEVITQITAGKMLSCPEKCPPGMYSIMISCWAKNSTDRTPMELLYQKIRRLTIPQPNIEE